MKFFAQAVIGALSLLSADAVQQQTDIYYHEKPVLGPSMWHFSPDGLTIFAPNGDVLKAHPKKMLCPSTIKWDGTPSDDCYYFSYASDGHKYVWAGSMAGDHSVQAFDIDTGDYAGYLDTCSTPLDMEYHPVRQEMYVRCAQEDTEGGNPGEIDVFSSATLSSDLPMVSFNATRRPYGRLAIHSSMGPYGYSLAYDQSFITELDLSSKEVSATYEIPDAYGGYDTAFSPVNQHLYFRSRVCCTCSSEAIVNEDPDVASCGRSGGSNVTVTTGPSKSDDIQVGVCSSGCEGSRADTIGVVEFDIVNKKFVANHNIKEGTGWGADVMASPDGKWIVMLPNDGGQNVRIMKAGKNGESSASTVRDIPVNFEGGTPGKTVVSDVAFVQDGNREILVIGASTDNDVVLVDLKTFATRKLNLAPNEAESTGGGARYLEWAVGSDYVWVNGGEAEHVYILKIPGSIESASLDRQIDGVRSGNMLHVNNYERVRTMAMANMAQGLTSATTSSSQSGSSSGAGTGAGNLAMLSGAGDPSFMSGSSAASASISDDAANSNVLAVVGVVLGALGLLAGLGALFVVTNQKNAAMVDSQPDVESAIDVKTLGSKRVN